MSAIGTTVVAPNWWDVFVAAAKAKLQALLATGEADAIAVFEAVEPIAVTAIETALSDLEQIALGAVLKQVPLIATGKEKFSAASIDVANTLQIAGKSAVMSDIWSGVQNAFNALGVAKAALAPPATA